MGNSKSVKRRNQEIVIAQPAGSNSTAVSHNIIDGTLHSLERRMDNMEMAVELLQKRISKIHAEQLLFEKSADEAISTYRSSVQLIMLFHGLASVFLQVNYPYAGAGVAFLMAVSFFSIFMVTYVVTLQKNERVSEFEKNLQGRQMELQNEVMCFGAKIETICSSRDFEYLARKGTLRGVLDRMDSLRRGNTALHKDLADVLALTNSKDNRMKLVFQVAVGAILYGLCFPTIAYYCLCFVGLRRDGLIHTM